MEGLEELSAKTLVQTMRSRSRFSEVESRAQGVKL